MPSQLAIDTGYQCYSVNLVARIGYSPIGIVSHSNFPQFVGFSGFGPSIMMIRVFETKM